MAEKPRKRIAANSGVMKSILDIQRQRDVFEQKVAKGEAKKYEPEPLIRPDKAKKSTFTPTPIQAPLTQDASLASGNSAPVSADEGDTDTEGQPRSAFTKSRVDLESGFMKRIQRHQKTRLEIEEQWKQEQEPEAVANRVKQSMPTQEQIRAHRKKEIIRTGPSARLAASVLGGALGRPPKRDPKVVAAKAKAKPAIAQASTKAESSLETGDTEQARRKRSQGSSGTSVFDRLDAGKADLEGKRAKQSPTEGLTKSVAGIRMANSKLKAKPLFKLQVQLGQGQSDAIAVYKGNDLFTLAQQFASKHGMNDKQCRNLHALLTRQLTQHRLANKAAAS